MLLVLCRGATRAIGAALLPPGESARSLLQAVRPWLDQATEQRTASLRHGPAGATPIDQRSCLVAPLVAGPSVLGALYADLEGPFGRFDNHHRARLAVLATQAAQGLANLRQTATLEAKVASSAA